MSRCVHCLGSFDRPGVDHIPPESWYPDNTPANLEKPKVPCCQACNNRLGGIENQFLSIAGLSLATTNPLAMGVRERALRSFNAQAGKSDRDRLARSKLQQKLRSLVHPIDSFARPVPIHGLEPHRVQTTKEMHAVEIPDQVLGGIAEKLARGTTFLLQGLYVEGSHGVRFGAMFPEAQEILHRFGVPLSCGPAFQLRKAAVADDPVRGYFEFRLWGSVVIFASVEPIVPEADDSWRLFGLQRHSS